MTHGDGEGVGDNKRTNNDGESGEQQQKRREKSELLFRTRLVFAGDAFAADHLDAPRKDPLDGCSDLRDVSAIVNDHIDGVDLAGFTKQCWRLDRSEENDRRAARGVGIAEANDTHHLHRARFVFRKYTCY